MTVRVGALTLVEQSDLGGTVLEDTLAGASTLVLDLVSDFDLDGGQVQVGEDVLTYTAVDFETDTLTLSEALAEDVEADTPVTPITDDENTEVEWVAHVDLGDDEEGDAAEAVIPTALVGYFTEGTDQAGMLVEVEANEDGWVVRSQPRMQPEMDGAVVETSTAQIGARIPNGTFEDVGRDKLFDEWGLSWWSGDPADSTWGEEVDSPIAGSRSLAIILAGDGASRTVVTNRVWPVTPGETIAVRASARGDRTVTAATDLAELIVMTSEAGKEPTDWFEPGVSWQNAATSNSLDATAERTLSGKVTVPADHVWMRVGVRGWVPNDGLPLTVVFDNVHRIQEVTAVLTAHLTANQAIPSGGYHRLTDLTIESSTTDDLYIDPAMPGVVRVRRSGHYDAVTTARWSPETTGRRIVRPMWHRAAGDKEGPGDTRSGAAVADLTTHMYDWEYLAAGDGVSMEVAQTSSDDPLDVLGGASQPTCTFKVARRGD